MKITAKERKAVRETFRLIEEAGLVEKAADKEAAKRFGIPYDRLKEVADYISESRLYTDNGKTMVRR